MHGVDRFYAHVFRGAFRYHLGNIGGLRRPFVGTPIKYAAYDANGQSQGVNIGNWSIWGINPNILIYRFNGGGEYDSDEIFSTTCHETAHSTHVSTMNAGYIQYFQVSSPIVESWPTAVEWMITQMEYRERGITNYSDPFWPLGSFPNLFGHQRWRLGLGIDDYASIFIDLVDNHNQVGINGGTITDNVTGYTLASIESVFLKHVYGYTSLRNELKAHKPSGVTDAQIDELLDQY